jgi:hypothetical protein
LTQSQKENNYPADPQRRHPQGGRHQIGTPAGFGSEQVAGFRLECMAGFVGIRTLPRWSAPQEGFIRIPKAMRGQ